MKINTKLTNNKIFWTIISIIILFLLGIPQNLFKKNVQILLSDQTAKEVSLETSFRSLTALDQNNNTAQIYDEYLLPSDKTKITREEFVRRYSRKTTPYSDNFTIHSIKVDGDRGIVDRTRTICLSETCTGKDKVENRVKKEYFFVNGKWYSPLDNNVYCERTEEYIYPEEFKRAVSLVIQRTGNSKLKESTEIAADYKKIRNCLDIQYLSGAENLEGAEGIFVFNKDSTQERLQIFVSTKYQEKDDLLTALLLAHEIHHAYLFATGQDKRISCYENEAEAFAMELGLYHFDFNQEEKTSINSRYSTTEEVKNFLDLYQAVTRNQQEYIFDSVLPIIQEDPSYRKQCANN